MPQLDKVTFLSQFFWLCVFFIGFYIVSLKFFLPQMSRILKYRKKRLSQSHQGVTSMQEENTKVRESTDRLLENGLKSSKEIFQRNLKDTQAWLIESTGKINQNEYKQTNYKYLQSLGKRCLSQNLSLQGGFHDFSSKVFITLLLKRLKHTSSQRLKGDSHLATKKNSTRAKKKGNTI